ncbi:MAG: TRAP transporter large permease subunit, partial [Pseudomonadota bacterium]
VLFALSLGLIYGELTWAGLLDAMVRAIRSTAAVMFILATVAIFAWVLTVERVPDRVAEAMFSLTDQTWILWLLILATLLFLGLFESASANLLIVTPILVPIAPALGIDLVHLGVVIVFALMVGQITPPVGITLFIVTEIAGVAMAGIVKALLPYIAAMILALLLVTYWDGLVLWLPRLLGYAGAG